jgi:hypothetical protein
MLCGAAAVPDEQGNLIARVEAEGTPGQRNRVLVVNYVLAAEIGREL